LVTKLPANLSVENRRKNLANFFEFYELFTLSDDNMLRFCKNEKLRTKYELKHHIYLIGISNSFANAAGQPTCQLT